MTSQDYDGFERSVLDWAEDAFARVMSGVDEQVERMPPDLEPADVLRWAGDRVTELVAGFAELPLDRMLGLANTSTGSADDHGRQPATPRGEPIIVRAARGSVAEARVWVHLIGEVVPATLRFVLSDLIGPDGAVWPSPGAAFTPAEIALPAPLGTATLLRLRIPEDAATGDHHGLVIAHGIAGAAVPVMVIIA